ncbi:NADPH-dependent FMN reductase [Lentibacillus sediminis]|uniref:NADPH-dependent FMN reductase n=1 Tax=Lentibacillus sediminis TaxID=1940529 RepID=UPI000C1C450D|nr:NADPH-dependent FMN reductase [Lentibacillus sediminis]
MKIAAMVGSNRKGSYNMKLAEYMQERYKAKLDIEILPIDQLPFYSQDEELDPPAIVKEVKDKIKQSDGVLIATPEYNGSISGMLKNAIDWFSRVDTVMVNKPTIVVGASMGGLGTVKAQLQLRQILNAPGLGALVLPGNEVLIGSVHEKMDEAGSLADEQTAQFIDTVVDNYINWAGNMKVYQ